LSLSLTDGVVDLKNQPRHIYWAPTINLGSHIMLEFLKVFFASCVLFCYSITLASGVIAIDRDELIGSWFITPPQGAKEKDMQVIVNDKATTISIRLDDGRYEIHPIDFSSENILTVKALMSDIKLIIKKDSHGMLMCNFEQRDVCYKMSKLLK
jgi:hypothetical protein